MKNRFLKIFSPPIIGLCNHTKLHSDGFACDKCCFVGKSDQLRQLHILVAHSDSEDLNWKCPRCNEGKQERVSSFSGHTKGGLISEGILNLVPLPTKGAKSLP